MTVRAERRKPLRVPRDVRHRAREAALQMLYQWEVGRLSMPEVHQEFWNQASEDDHAPLGDDLRAFATALAEGVAARVGEIDPIVADAAEHWRLDRMSIVDRLILRLAVYEFLHEPQTPVKVIINEALELAHAFSGDEAVRFVNGVLDAVRRRLDRE
jgi:transcription antitermination protein NusB